MSVDVYRHKFYSYGNNPQQRCKDDAGDGKFMVSYQTKYFDRKDGVEKASNTYSFFEDYQAFDNWYNTLPDEEKCVYEQYGTDTPLAEYYDIDGDWTNDFYNNTPFNRVVDMLIEARQRWIKTTEYSNKEGESNYLVLDGSRDGKTSIHLTVRNGFVFKRIKDLKKFATDFNKFLKEEGHPISLDLSVYNNNSLFRVLGSRKRQINGKSNAPLRRSSYNEKSLNCDKSLFFNSYIEDEIEAGLETVGYGYDKNLNGCRKIGLEYCNYVKGFEDDVVVVVKRDIPELEDDDLSNLYELIEEMILNKEHSLCDEEYPDRLSYNNWKNLAFAVLKEGGSFNLFSRVFELYRHNENLKLEQTYDSMGQYSTGYSLGREYLHHYAKENERYKEVMGKTAVRSFEEIRDTPVKERTKEEQDYYEEIMRKIEKKNIDILTETEGFVERKYDRFVNVEDLDKSGSGVVVKGGLGKGKTTATVKHINSNDYDFIVILTPRRSYAKTTLSRINDEVKLKNGEKFVLYSDIKGSIRDRYIIIQVESLNRFDYNFDNKKTLLVMDEVESLMYQMTSHKTHAGNHLQNIEMFENLIKKSSKVLFMDAFISNKTLNCLRNMGCKFDYYNYTKELEKRTAIDLQKKNILLNKLIEELELGKKVFFFCSSRAQITDYFLPEIIKKVPNKNVIEYHSKKTSIDVKRINEDWSKADLIVCTCTITVGCNFDLPNVFSSIFVYASACSRNLVRDIFQSTYRVRHIIDKRLYFCLDERHMGLNLTTNLDEIKRDLELRKEIHTKHYEKYLDIPFTNETPKWVKELLISNIFESNMSIMRLKPLFYKYLDLCNYTLQDLTEQDLDALDFQEEEEVKLVFEDYRYEDIPEITFTQRQEYLNKKKKEPLTDLEEFMLNKSFFQATLIVEGRSNIKMSDQITLWNIYCNYGKNKFRNLQYEKGFRDGTVRICDIISVSYPELASNLSKRLEDIRDITKRLGLKNSQDFGEIKRDVVLNNLEWLEQNSKRFHSNFGLRNRSKGEFTLKNASELLGKLFSSWGYSSIKRGKQRKKRIDKKLVDCSDYICCKTEDIDVYENLQGKRVKETEKKVKLLRNGEMPL